MNEKISVVVPTHDRGNRLLGLISALNRQTLDPTCFEVILVDDGSSPPAENTLATATERPPNVTVLRHPSARGPAAARNTGWHAARGQTIAFTDDDCEPAPEWLESVMAAAQAHPEALIQGRTEPIPEEILGIGPFSRTLRVTGLGPFFPTCNMTYPRDTLERLGGFDESYPLPGGEDTDLALRARAGGVPIIYRDDVLVHHAVNQYGPLGKLRWAMHWSDAMKVFGDHPELRRELRYGIFWKESHAFLVLALIGLATRRPSPTLLLALPYGRHLWRRRRAEGAGVALTPYLALYDLIETYATLRGALRHRVLVA